MYGFKIHKKYNTTSNYACFQITCPKQFVRIRRIFLNGKVDMHVHERGRAVTNSQLAAIHNRQFIRAIHKYIRNKFIHVL